MIFVTHLYPNPAQPHEAAFNRQLAAALARRVPLTVVAPLLCPLWWPLTWRRRVPARETIAGVDVRRPRAPYTPGIFLARHAAMLRRALRRPLKQALEDGTRACAPAGSGPRTVLIGFLYPDAVAAAPLMRAWNRPYALRLNGSDFHARIGHPRIGALVRRELRLAPRVFCPGDRLAEAVRALEGVVAERVVAFRNGVDRNLFYPADPPSRPSGAWTPIARPALYVGHLKAGKGIDRLIRAWARLHEAGGGYALVIVGEGPERRRLERLARALGIRESVSFAGGLSHAAVAEVMRRSVCLCLPSRGEGMPNVVVEALACGIPVVGTDVGEIPNLISDGVNGFVVPAGGRAEEDVVAALTGALRRVFENDWNAGEIAESVADCDWDRAAATILQSFKQIPLKDDGSRRESTGIDRNRATDIR